MIHTSKQLKDKVRNISKGDNEVAKALIRIFMMERFLERVSLSKYKNNFILKVELIDISNNQLKTIVFCVTILGLGIYFLVFS